MVRAPLDGFDSDDLENSGPSGCQVAYTVMQPFQRRYDRLGSERHGCASQDCKENEESCLYANARAGANIRDQGSSSSPLMTNQ